MDDRLAYCLDRFIKEQVKLIDKRIKDIEQEEIIECGKLEQDRDEYEQKKPPPKDKGSFTKDQELVERYTRDLRACEQIERTKTIIEDQQCLDNIEAEVRTKVGALATYVERLKNLAERFTRKKNFIHACNEMIDYTRPKDVFEMNFYQLCQVLKETDSKNLTQNVQRWWKESYGSRIADLNRRNEKIHPAINEKGYVTVSPSSRIMASCAALLEARKILIDEPPTLEIIGDFVHQLHALDEDERKRNEADTLIERLNRGTIDQAIAYAQQWLKQRDDLRNQNDDYNPYQEKLVDAKAEYSRRRIAQEAKKLALAATLCRLAVGSGKDEQFEQLLKKTVQEQNENRRDGFPVISGDIKTLDEEPLAFIIQLVLSDIDMQAWVDNENDIHERFSAGLCRGFGIPEKSIRVDRFDAAQSLVHLFALPPYSKRVTDSLNGNAMDAAARMAALRKFCVDLNINIESITLGDFDLNIEDKLMDPRWNTKYIWPDQEPSKGYYWREPQDRGGKPYYCPSGWIRYGVKVAKDQEEFDAKWGNWHIAYHGTRGEFASNILTSGLRVSTQGCFYAEEIPRVYVSPSIEYCAHPRYALPWNNIEEDGQSIWYQLVFQCRVNPASIDRISPETLILNDFKESVTIDPNFDNNELEWIVLDKRGVQYMKDDIICYGIMMRVSSEDPATLTPAQWWEHSHDGNIYKT